MEPRKFLHILALSALLAGYSAWTLPSRNPRTPSADESIPLPHALPLVRTDAALQLWQDPGTLFVDVRPAADYEIGHIAGALSVPETEFEARFPALRERLTRARVLVVYCKSRDCGQSLWTAIRLHNAGLTQTTIYPEGWNEWVNRGLPVTRTGN